MTVLFGDYNMKKIKLFCNIFYFIFIIAVFIALLKSNIRADSITWWICVLALTASNVNGYIEGYIDNEKKENENSD